MRCFRTEKTEVYAHKMSSVSYLCERDKMRTHTRTQRAAQSFAILQLLPYKMYAFINYSLFYYDIASDCMPVLKCVCVFECVCF